MALNQIFESLWWNFLIFQQNKVETIKTPGLLKPLSIPSQRWEEVSMYFIIGLPKSEGNNVIMVVVNRVNKYAHFCALSHSFKANTTSTAFMEAIQKLHGNPKIIVSDRDNRRSTTGYVFIVGGIVVSWVSKSKVLWHFQQQKQSMLLLQRLVKRYAILLSFAFILIIYLHI